jgi:hypothetical protein
VRQTELGRADRPEHRGVRSRLAEDGVLAYPRPPHRIRFVTRRRIGDPDIDRAAEAVAALTASLAPGHP